jgi:uncharacterized membrane protein YfcA
MIPAVIAGAFAGKRIVKMIPEKAYRYFIFIVIFLSSLMLLVK